MVGQALQWGQYFRQESFAKSLATRTTVEDLVCCAAWPYNIQDGSTRQPQFRKCLHGLRIFWTLQAPCSDWRLPLPVDWTWGTVGNRGTTALGVVHSGRGFQPSSYTCRGAGAALRLRQFMMGGALGAGTKPLTVFTVLAWRVQYATADFAPKAIWRNQSNDSFPSHHALPRSSPRRGRMKLA